MTSQALLGLICCISSVQAAGPKGPPVNALGLPVRDGKGHALNYRREELGGSASLPDRPIDRADKSAKGAPSGSVPAGGSGSAPFWQYSIFGSGIGGSNIILAPPPAGGGGPEIIVGGNSRSDFGSDDFWQVLRHNPTTGNYDQVFVSPIYSSSVPGCIKNIVLGNVVGDSRPELVVMLSDGRIYFYDVATRAELGFIDTSIIFPQRLSLFDLDGDGLMELILINADDLFVFGGDGSLRWQVAGAGGYDIAVGQMDNDPGLEIATSNKVVDVATQTVQWTRPGPIGWRVKLAPLPGASYQQLIVAEGWYHAYAYDVATQSPRWSVDAFLDIGDIEVADVDNDGMPELLLGDGQWGQIHVYDLITQAQKWQTPNPEYGVSDIVVGDVDNDGVVDLLWPAGYGSTGADYLYVASTTGNHAIKWQNVDLVGPFLGPSIGDLDGDGLLELVVCSYASAAGYDSGRILVFDLATLTLRAMSAPVVNNRAWEGVQQLKLRDLEGDGRMEIVLAASDLHNGAIEIYGFNSDNTFSLKWTNTARPSGWPFRCVDVADLDGNGTPEIIGTSGKYIYIYDYPSGTDPWISPPLSAEATNLVVDDLDGNGSKEFAALDLVGDLFTFEGPNRLWVDELPQGGTIITSRVSPPGLIKGDSAGVGHFFQFSNNNYTESFARQLGSAALDGINVLPYGALWTGTNGALSLRVPPYDGVEWQSPPTSPKLGRAVATATLNGQPTVFSSAQHVVAAFTYDSSLPPPPPVPIAPATLGNISTRLRVETGDNVVIAGFIVSGTQPKKIIVRGLGPSLPLAGALANPVLELHDSSGALIASNNDWRTDQEAQIIATGIPPTNNLESAIVATLPANGSAYTAVMHEADNGTGIGLVELYDLDPAVDSKLANISTRGFVQTGDDVMIAGTILLGPGPQQVLVRAIGPSLPLAGTLANPMLELRDQNGALLRANDDWRNDQEAQIIATGIPPTNDREAAVIATLPASGASYTAIVRGVGGTTGVALVEVYGLN